VTCVAILYSPHVLNVAGHSDSAEGRYVEMRDPICEACGGDRILTIYVTGAENSDGRNTWDWTGLEWTGLPWRGSDRGVVSGLTVGGRTDVPYRTVQFRTLPYRTLPHSTVPYRTVQFRTVPYRTVPYRTVPYRTVPYRTVPYRTVQYSTVLWKIWSIQSIHSCFSMQLYIYIFIWTTCFNLFSRPSSGPTGLLFISLTLQSQH